MPGPFKVRKPSFEDAIHSRSSPTIVIFGSKAEWHWNAGETAGSDFAICQSFGVTYSSWFTIINTDDHSGCPKYLLSLQNVQTFPFNGNLPEIVSETDSGRKFTKSIKCHITSFWSSQTSWGPNLIPLSASLGTIAPFWLWYSQLQSSVNWYPIFIHCTDLLTTAETLTTILHCNSVVLASLILNSNIF